MSATIPPDTASLDVFAVIRPRTTCAPQSGASTPKRTATTAVKLTVARSGNGKCIVRLGTDSPTTYGQARGCDTALATTVCRTHPTERNRSAVARICIKPCIQRGVIRQRRPSAPQLPTPRRGRVPMQKRVITCLLPVALAFAATASCNDSTEPSNTISYVANLRASNEVNANGTSANVNSPNSTGTWTGTLNTSTNVLSWTMTYSGLVANSSASHIHAQAPTTSTANVVLNFATFSGSTITLGATSGTASGSINLGTAATPPSLTISGDSLRKAIDAGQAYVNVHSSQYGAGEIRGQIVKQ